MFNIVKSKVNQTVWGYKIKTQRSFTMRDKLEIQKQKTVSQF